MAWDGTIYRRRTRASIEPPDSIRVTFECGHVEILHKASLRGISDRREWPCQACSKLTRESIAAIRESIQFSDVLEKIKRLADDEMKGVEEFGPPQG